MPVIEELEEEMNDTNTSLLSSINDVIKDVDLGSVTQDGLGEDLPEGYFLTEVVKTELKFSKASGKPMACIQLKVVNSGYGYDDKADEYVALKGCKNKYIFVYYPFKDGTSFKRFVSDMIKFEGEEAGEPVLPKEAWTTAETMQDSLEVLQDLGSRIWVNRSATTRDGNTSVYNHLLSWKKAEQLGLPE